MTPTGADPAKATRENSFGQHFGTATKPYKLTKTKSK